MAEKLSRRNDQPVKMKFSIRTLMLLTLCVAFCFAAQPWIGFGSSIVLAATGGFLLCRQAALAIFTCYFAFLLLPPSLIGFVLWIFISIAIFSWPWMETALERHSKTDRHSDKS